MFLLAITTLIISLLGLYTQLLSVEAARLAANQTAYGQTMIGWHDAAVSMAASILDSNSATYYALSPQVCALDAYTTLVGQCPLPSNPVCQKGSCTSATGTLNVNGTCTTGIVALADKAGTQCNIYNTRTGSVELVHLPPSYNSATYQYNSILYNTGSGTNYVVTYLVRPAAGTVTLPNGTSFNINAGDMMRQVKLATHGAYMYGYLTNTAAGTAPVMHTQYTVGTTTSPIVTFTFPAALNCVATPCPLDGAIALVSSPDGL